MSTRIYVVEGSEDGVIGAFTSSRRAAEEALRYATLDGSQDAEMYCGAIVPGPNPTMEATVDRAARRVREDGTAIVCGRGPVEAHIIRFYD